MWFKLIKQAMQYIILARNAMPFFLSKCRAHELHINYIGLC